VVFERRCVMLTNEDWKQIVCGEPDEDRRAINWRVSQAFMGDEFEDGIWDKAQAPVKEHAGIVRHCGNLHEKKV
jgi:hypothetical protein